MWKWLIIGDFFILCACGKLKVEGFEIRLKISAFLFFLKESVVSARRESDFEVSIFFFSEVAFFLIFKSKVVSWISLFNIAISDRIGDF